MQQNRATETIVHELKPNYEMNESSEISTCANEKNRYFCH